MGLHPGVGVAPVPAVLSTAMQSSDPVFAAPDGPDLTRRFARTYGGPESRDGWTRVREYRRVHAFVSQHPELGSSAVASALDLPRSRIRAWVDRDGRPDPVRGLETARDHGWLTRDFDTATARALNVLVAWVFSGGSIAAGSYVPSFTFADALTRETLRSALGVLELPTRIERDDDGHRATELVPAEDASILGRVLVAWGAPLGTKNERTDLSLPGYLQHAPEQVRLDFARTYILNRGHIRSDRMTFPVQVTEYRSPEYRDQVLRLFRAVAEEPSTVRASGERTVWLDPEASDRLYMPPEIEE